MGRDDSCAARNRARRAGRVRVWIPFLLVLAAAAWVSERLSGEVLASGYARVDTRRASLLPAGALLASGGFVDERWEPLLRAAIARVPPFDAGDERGLERLAQSVGELPFVADVGEPRARWPDGIDLAVRLRDVVACARVGDLFYAVSSDGVLLPGGWPAPPWLHGGYLPVIGPNDRSLDGACAGSRLSEPRHRDALAVAISMRASLSPADFETLGPPLIDATRSRQATVDEPGILVRWNRERAVLFGRSPDCGEPGELPAAAKWRAVSDAARVLRESGGARDWSLLDARWDTPEIRWREPAPDTVARAAERASD
jgi:hypothetical protein